MDGLGPRTVKSGLIQVKPPFEMLEHMVTLRMHLDTVDERDVPGRLPETEIEHLVAMSGGQLCLAKRGDVWLYATSINHASAYLRFYSEFSARAVPNQRAA